MALSNWATLSANFELYTKKYLDGSDEPFPEHIQKQYAPLHQQYTELFEQLIKNKQLRTKENYDKLEKLNTKKDKAALETIRARVIPQTDKINNFFDPINNCGIDIYKNYARLNLQGHKLTIDEGKFMVSPYQYVISRGPSDGVYVVIYDITSDFNQTDNFLTRTYTGYVGCGVYGWDTPKAYNSEEEFLNMHLENNAEEKNQTPDFIGVSNECVNFIKTSLSEQSGIPLYDLPLETEAEVFNQGDAFFSDNYGIETPKSKPGQKIDPFINDALEGFLINMKEEQND